MNRNRLRPLRRGRQIGLGRPVDLSRDLGQQPLLVGLGPYAAADEVVAQSGDRVFGPMRAHIGVAAVAARIVGGGVVAQAIGQRLDQVRPAAGPRLGDGAGHRLAHRDDVVAVDLLTLDAGGDRLLRQRLGGGLLSHRDRDRPMVVVDDKDQRQTPHAGDVERLGDIALRGGAVAKDADRDPMLAPELEGERHADRMRRVGPDRHADREILARLGKVAAALVAAPEQEQLDQADPAPQLRAVLAKARQKHILLAHRSGDPDGYRLLAQCRGKSAEPTGPLQRDRLCIEGARQHHRPIERRQLGAIGSEIGQRAHRIAFGVEKPAVADLEPRDQAVPGSHGTFAASSSSTTFSADGISPRR